MKIVLLSFILFALFLSMKFDFDDDLSKAFLFSKKGIHWGLSNLSAKKSKTENKLIDNNKLISKIKVEKEVNGYRFESVGFYESTEVSIVLHRSFDELLKEGYLKIHPDSIKKNIDSTEIELKKYKRKKKN